MSKRCTRCGSTKIEYNDNVSTNVTTIECQSCGYLGQEEYEKEEEEEVE